MRTGRSLYEILQVDPRAEPEVLEAAFRRLARKYHPDVSTSGDSVERMKELNGAYEVLRDPGKRADYDRALFEPDDDEWFGTSSFSVDPEPVVQSVLACRQHGGESAVATCNRCGAGLCEYCFGRFQPASCLTCALAAARNPRRRYLLPALWFFLVLGAMLAIAPALLTRASP
jgi:curved DNA-binding protein CbpA